MVAETAEQIGLPRGVLNVVTADREVSELLVRDPASTRSPSPVRPRPAARSRRSAASASPAARSSSAGSRPRSSSTTSTSAAAATIAGAECVITGQVCSSLTRIVVSRHRHDELVEALASVRRRAVGDPFDEATQMGPLAMSRQRDRVEGYIAKGVDEGATLAAGGGRPKDLDRGWYIEPTVFGNVDNWSTIAQEEIFGPVLSVIPADDEQEAVRIANDTISGSTRRCSRTTSTAAREVAGQLRSGTVGHNNWPHRLRDGVRRLQAVGNRSRRRQGRLLPFLETKTVILEGRPSRYKDGKSD